MKPKSTESVDNSVDKHPSRPRPSTEISELPQFRASKNFRDQLLTNFLPSVVSLSLKSVGLRPLWKWLTISGQSTSNYSQWHSCPKETHLSSIENMPFAIPSSSQGWVSNRDDDFKTRRNTRWFFSPATKKCSNPWIGVSRIIEFDGQWFMFLTI